MDKKTKESLQDFAAEVVVSPLRAYAKARELKQQFDASETGHKVKAYAVTAGEEIKGAAEKIAASDTAQKVKGKYEELKGSLDDFTGTAEEKAKEYAGKAKDFGTDAYDKAKDFSDNVTEKAREFSDRVAEKAEVYKAEAPAAKTPEEKETEE